MASERRIPIVATTRSDGKGKTKNATPDQVHRTDVMNHEDAFFYTNIVMSACVHGVWDEKNNDMTQTTFILFTCEIQSMREFRARKIKLQIDFRNVDSKDGKQAPSNPTIVSRGPEIIERFHKIPVLNKKERGIKGLIEAPAAVVKPGIELHKLSSQEYSRQYFAEAKSGVRHASATDHRYTRVWWKYTENSKGAEGVVPGFRIAVLLKRDNDSPFIGQVAITEFDAGWRYPSAVAWHDLWSEGDPDAEEDKIIDPINFDPNDDDILPKWLTGVNSRQLADLQTETGIDKKYARVWGVDL